MTWTDERVADLRRLHTDGRSASQIAEALGLVTRNAVIGKLHRLGLSSRSTLLPKAPKAKPMQPQPQPRRSARTATFNPTFAPPPMKPVVTTRSAIDPDAVPLDQRKTLFQLTSRTCKWPYGDVGASDFFFCGADKDPVSGPYCPMHQRVSRGQG